MDEQNRIGTLDYLIVLTKWSRVIIGSFIISCILAFTFSSLLPKWYKATAVIFPPQNELSNFGLSSFVQNLPLRGLGLFGESQDALIYMAILQSRSAMEAIAHKFKLQSLYETPNLEKTLDVLSANVDYNIEKEGTISISVLDKSPERAAQMANSFVYYLDSLNTDRKVKTARNNRIYIQKRYKKSKDELALAEDTFKRFQENSGVVSLPEQTEEAIKSISNLYAEKIATEINLRIKEKNFSPQHLLVLEAKTRLDAINHKIDELTNSSIANLQVIEGNNHATELFIPLNQLPEIGLQYARYYRDVEIKAKIFELLTQLYEQSKIQEAKDTPTIQVLDPAIPPIRKAKPKRLIWLMVAGTLSLLVTIMYAFSIEYMKRKEIEHTAEIEKISLIKSHLRESLRFRRRNQ